MPPPNGKRGRQQSFSDAAIQTCLTLKVLFGLPLRQTSGFVESLLRLAGLDWEMPDYSTLCRRQKTLNVRLPYRGGKGPLNLLIDSTGIKAEGERGTPRQSFGRSRGGFTTKIDLLVNAHGLPMRTEITPGQTSDYLGFDLVVADNLPAPRVLLADRGYDADRIRKNMDARDVLPVIPMRKSRKQRIGVDRSLYRLRNLVERRFNKLKSARRVATRYDKTAESFLGFVDITSIRLWLRHLST